MPMHNALQTPAAAAAVFNGVAAVAVVLVAVVGVVVIGVSEAARL